MDSKSAAQYVGNGIFRMLSSVLHETQMDFRERRFLIHQLRIQKQKQKTRTEDAIHIPPFLIASITEQCNLHCSGCYARGCGFCTDTAHREMLTANDWKRIFQEADILGISAILLTGGEPLMNRPVLSAATDVKNLIFPVFTNGTLFDTEFEKTVLHHRNLFPVFSLEGTQKTTDMRRGTGVYEQIRTAMDTLKQHKIPFGISITVSAKNLEEITSSDFLRTLNDTGVCVMFLIEYTATSADDKDMELNEITRKKLADFLDTARNSYRSIWFLSFPGDEDFLGGCLAAGRGFFHINPYGDAEPCPFSPVSDRNLKTCSLRESLQSPLFYRMIHAGFLKEIHTGGCALAGKTEELRNFRSVKKE